MEDYSFEDGMTDISMFRIARDLMFIRHFTLRDKKTNLKMNIDRHLECAMTRFRLGISQTLLYNTTDTKDILIMI